DGPDGLRPQSGVEATSPQAASTRRHRKGGRAMQELIGALSLASIYVLFALGMSLTWGTIDILNFAHGSIFMFSAFTAYLALQSASLSFLVVLLIGVLAGAAMSLLTQVLAFEQIIKRAKDKRSAEMQILIGGIGVAIIP